MASSYCDFVQNAGKDSIHRAYHDNEYGFPLHSDDELFARLVLEINQAGLSWTTILKKQEGFRKAYHNFNIKKVAAYTGVKKIIVTENGAAFNDRLESSGVHDPYRINYLQQHIAELKRVKDEGIHVKGYFVWSFIDNFEWSEGYHPRFGIVYVDFKTQKRVIKDSGYWYQQFLKDHA